MKATLILAILCAGAMLASCNRDKASENVAPEITLVSTEQVQMQDALDPELKVQVYRVKFDFIDMNGDLGVDDSDKAAFPPTPSPPASKLDDQQRDSLNKNYNTLKEYYCMILSRTYAPFDPQTDDGALQNKFLSLDTLYEDVMERYYHCLLVDYYKDTDADKVLVKQKTPKLSRIFSRMEGYAGEGTMLEGTMTFDIDLTTRMPGTMRFEFRVRDRSGMLSNTLVTPEITPEIPK